MTGLGMDGLLMAWHARKALGTGVLVACAAAPWLAFVYCSSSAVCLDIGKAMK